MSRGIVIFLVVVGHIVPGKVGTYIFLFHMPFFFLISGYFHKDSMDAKSYLVKKTISLLIPYLVYLFIFNAPHIAALAYQAVQELSFQNILIFVKYLLKLLYGGEALKGTTGIFWFVTCLFITQQVFNILLKRYSKKTILQISLFAPEQRRF